MNRLFTHGVWLLVLATVGFADSAKAENDLLSVAATGNQSAKESIRSLSCTISLESRGPSPTMQATGKYWRVGNDARLQEEQPLGTVDYHYIGAQSEVREVVRNRPGSGQPGYLVARRLITELAHPLDVWRCMFLEFDLLLPAAKRAPRVKRDKLGGKECIRVAIDFRTETEVTFWLDPSRNFLVLKRTFETKGDRSEVEVIEVAEPQAGVFMPVKTHGRSYRGSELRAEGYAILSDVRVNEAMDKNIVRPPAVPRSTICDDWIKKQKYPVDENWQPIPGARAEHIERYALPAPPPDPAFTGQSTREARSWTWWLAPASLALLLVAGVAWVYRRRRSRALGSES